MLELRVLGATDLRASDHTAVHSVLAQPKRLALLVYLLLAAPGSFVRRETLLALFWPESDSSRARTALRKAIHYLRRSLGAGILVGRGDDELAIDTKRLDCDALRLRRLSEAGDFEAAAAVYAGELLPGFHVDGAPAFERWLEAERSALRRLGSEAAVAAARRAAASGDLTGALNWQRRAHEISPHDEDILRDALVLLIRSDQRSAARDLLDAHRVRLAEELGREVDPALEAVLAGDGSPATSDSTTAYAWAGEAVPLNDQPREPSEIAARDRTHAVERPPVPVRVARRSRRKRWLLLAGGACALLLAAWLSAPRLSGPAPADEPTPLIAIGAVRDFTAGTDSIGRLIPDLLATNLARQEHLRVVGGARLHELVAMAGGDVRSPSATSMAARGAGVQELVGGALYRLPSGKLRLDLRHIRLSTGELLGTYRVIGADPFELVDRATARLTADLGASSGRSLRVADVTTRSLVALRFYGEGLDAYYHGDPDAADRLFDAALEEDSTFAMAAYFGGLANGAHGDTRIRYLRRAERLSHRTTERERLLIQGTLAYFLEKPERLAITETLVARYPEDPAGQLLYGWSLIFAGRFADAIIPLRRTVALDSLALERDAGLCRACEALTALATTYLYLDSASAAERVTRRAHMARPSSVAFMPPLAQALQANGKLAEADALWRKAGGAGLPMESVALGLIANDIRRGEFARADAALRGFIDTAPRNLRGAGRWWLIISLRNQGRLEDALAVIEDERRDPERAAVFPDVVLLTEATVRYERGEFARAARLYDSLAASVPGNPGEARWSRNTAWNLTHAANAHAAAGHLDVLARLADTIRTVGARSAYGRDHRLHHHVLGLLAAARGRPAEAVAEYRSALFSIASGYTRTNLELARTLMAGGRAAEAVTVLEPPLRNGGLQSTLYYATRTELQAVLGEAYMRMGRPDLARVELDRALHAWRHADPQFRSRIAELERLRRKATGESETARATQHP